MKKALESLFILNIINNYIQQILKSLLKASKNGTDEILFLIAKSQILILTDSYLEEWDNFLGKDSDEAIKNQLIIHKGKAKPAIDRIKKWDGLREFRNTVLAHNFRNKKSNYQSVFTNNHPVRLKIPDHISEITLLSDCIGLATNIVCLPFRKNLEEKSIREKSMDFLRRKNELRKIDYRKEIEEIKNKIGISK